MDALDVIAGCMLILTCFGCLVCAIAVLLGLRLLRTLSKVERAMESFRGEGIPMLSEGRRVMENVREMSVVIRNQVGRSEPSVEVMLHNLQDITTRVRDGVQGATALLSAAGKVARLFTGK